MMSFIIFFPRQKKSLFDNEDTEITFVWIKLLCGGIVLKRSCLFQPLWRSAHAGWTKASEVREKSIRRKKLMFLVMSRWRDWSIDLAVFSTFCWIGSETLLILMHNRGICLNFAKVINIPVGKIVFFILFYLFQVKGEMTVCCSLSHSSKLKGKKKNALHFMICLFHDDLLLIHLSGPKV